jgi:pyruvate carboxylase
MKDLFQGLWLSGVGMEATVVICAAVHGPTPTSVRSTPVVAIAGEVRASAPGKILRMAVKPGDRVNPHDLLWVLETMKIESRIEAPMAGTIKAVHVSAGETVQTGQALVTLV